MYYIVIFEVDKLNLDHLILHFLNNYKHLDTDYMDFLQLLLFVCLYIFYNYVLNIHDDLYILYFEKYL